MSYFDENQGIVLEDGDLKTEKTEKDHWYKILTGEDLPKKIINNNPF